MYRLTILYSTPQDPEHFRRHYREVHIPLGRKVRGLTGWDLQWTDGTDDWFLVAELYAPDEATMNAGLASPEGEAVRADLENFVTGRVVFLGGEVEEVALG